MSASEAIIRAISAAAIRPVTVNSAGEITGVGTAISLNFVRGEKFAIGQLEGGASGSTTDEKIEAQAGNGITVVYDKETKRIDKNEAVVTGAAAGGSGGGNGDVVGITAFQVTKAMMQAIHEYIGGPWQMWVQVGENVTSAENFEVYLLGGVSSPPEISAEPETAVQWSFDVQGGASYTKASGVLDSALAWAPAAITPVGTSTAITPTPLLEADVAATTYSGSGAPKGLLSGRAVIK